MSPLANIFKSINSDKIGITNILVVCCVGASLFNAPLAIATSVTQIIVLLSMVGLFGGGLAGLAMGLIARKAPRSQYGISFGMAQSANVLAYGFGPLIGGIVANLVNTRIVFIIEAVTYILAAGNAVIFLKKTSTPSGE